VHLIKYIGTQISTFFPELFPEQELTAALSAALPAAHEHAVFCLGYHRAFRGIAAVDPLHSRQYATLLYFLGRELHAVSPRVSQGAAYLNKVLHGVDLYGHIDLPRVFVMGHTSGIVLGDASYGENLVFFHGVTVGRYRDQRPHIGKNVVLFSDVQILGRARIGDGTVISAGTRVVNEVVPDNVLVVQGKDNKLIFKEKKEEYISEFLYLQ
jgi:serine O-acetyltransferase